jgi:hypothetical protein
MGSKLGGLKILLVMGEYGLSGLWVKRESTVSTCHLYEIIK